MNARTIFGFSLLICSVLCAVLSAGCVAEQKSGTDGLSSFILPVSVLTGTAEEADGSISLSSGKHLGEYLPLSGISGYTDVFVRDTLSPDDLVVVAKIPYPEYYHLTGFDPSECVTVAKKNLQNRNETLSETLARLVPGYETPDRLSPLNIAVFYPAEGTKMYYDVAPVHTCIRALIYADNEIASVSVRSAAYGVPTVTVLENKNVVMGN
ncbi:MAG: hypothetical protein Q4Q04_02850, partial [Methanocorpusculum sp.]|nr:hypothetical protein [Methanocorpusculum sp.]